MTDVLMTLDENGGNIVVIRGRFNVGEIVELLLNGEFTTTLNSWIQTVGSGYQINWKSGGYAELYGADPDLEEYCSLDQQIQTVVGVEYRIITDVLEYTSKSSILVGTGQGMFDLLEIKPTGTGENSETFIAASPATWVRLYHTGLSKFSIDDVSVKLTETLSPAGEVKLTDGIETNILNALFGGRTDPGWWGNLLGGVSYRSETQMLLETLPLTSGNLVRIETAVRKDLENAGMTDVGDVVIAIPQPNRVSITVGEIVIERDWT